MARQQATWAAFRPKLERTLLAYLKKGLWGIKGIQDRDEVVHLPYTSAPVGNF